MPTTEAKWLTPSVGSDEAGSGSFFWGLTTAVAKLTEEKIEIIKKQPGFKEFRGYARKSKEERAKDKDLKQIERLSWNLRKILKRDEDYKIWTLKPDTYEDILNRSKSEKDVKLVAHRGLHQQFEGCGLPHVVDRFGVAEDEDKEKYEKAFNGKSCSPGTSISMSIAVAEILAVDFACFGYEKGNFPIGYNESHKPGVSGFFDWLFNNLDPNTRKSVIDAMFKDELTEEKIKKYLDLGHKKKPNQ